MTASLHRCVHEMLLGQCSTCSRHPDDRLYEPASYAGPDEDWSPTAKGSQPLPVRSMLADFPSECPTCANNIRAGQQIFKVDDLWVCSECGGGPR